TKTILRELGPGRRHTRHGSGSSSALYAEVVSADLMIAVGKTAETHSHRALSDRIRCDHRGGCRVLNRRPDIFGTVPSPFAEIHRGFGEADTAASSASSIGHQISIAIGIVD